MGPYQHTITRYFDIILIKINFNCFNFVFLLINVPWDTIFDYKKKVLSYNKTKKNTTKLLYCIK